MKRRRFEFTKGTSNKFWEVWVEGATAYSRWGRIGADGKTTTWGMLDAEEARALANKKIKEKLRKGYREVFGKRPVQTMQVGDELYVSNARKVLTASDVEAREQRKAAAREAAEATRKATEAILDLAPRFSPKPSAPAKPEPDPEPEDQKRFRRYRPKLRP